MVDDRPNLLCAFTRSLPLQQQSVLLLACRGPDGMEKAGGVKPLVAVIRGTVMCAAKFGRHLEPGEEPDSFMNRAPHAPRPQSSHAWRHIFESLEHSVDAVPLHAFQHLACACAILRKHPHEYTSVFFTVVYEWLCDYMHMLPEPIETMDKRLDDWGRRGWNS